MAEDLDKLRSNAVMQYEKAVQHEQHNWDDAADDLEFAAGQQWEEGAKREREKSGRPCQTLNRMGQFIRQVTGDVRMNRPAIKVRPVDSGSDPKLAEALTGVIRHIEHISDAYTAYNQALENATICGMGNFRVTTEYADDSGFDLDIRIRPIHNPFAVVWDPAARELSRDDANYCFVTSYMSKEVFKATYPQAQITDWDSAHTHDLEGVDLGSGWFTDDAVRVVEYWCKKPVVKSIARLSDGAVVDVTDKSNDEVLALQPVKVRDVNSHKVVQYIMTGAEVLETHDWPGKYIPIIPVWGQEINVGERVVRYGIVRWAKDAQRSYNYHRSAAIETIALTPKQPFILTTEEVRGQEHEWAAANVHNKPYLLFNPDPRVGNQRPMRQPPAAPNIAALQEAEVSDNDMKATTGIYDSSLGQRSNETSGKAIIARERQGDTGTYVYIDHLAKAIAYCGRQLVDLIPKIYDTERQLRILGEDGSTTEFVSVNQQVIDPLTGETQIINDLSAGTYDVAVETGPAYSTKRQEAADSMMQFMQAVPQSAAVIADLIAKNMDWPGGDEMAKRLKKMLPPGMAEPEDGEEPPPDPGPPPELMMKMAEMELKQKQVEADIAAKQAKTEADIQTAQAKAQNDMALAIEKTRAEMALRMMEAQQRQQPPAINVNGESLGGTMNGLQAGFQQLGQAMAQMAQAIGQLAEAQVQGQQQVIAAITAPKQVMVSRTSNGLITDATITAGRA